MQQVERMSVAFMLIAAGLGAFGGEARAQQCKTGAVELTAISQVEYEVIRDQAGPDACVTSRTSGVTVCQTLPKPFSYTWTVGAEAPEGGGDAQSAVELEVATARSCLFDASTPVESTDSRWVQAVAHYEVPDETQPLDFIAVVQIGPGSQTTATVCPLGDGYDGRQCQQWAGWQ